MGVIAGEEVYRILKRQGVTRLYHANTVATSLSFLREGALLSRETCDLRGYMQTEQPSDADDKYYRIFSNVFADTDDYHRRLTRANTYGPVLFVLDAAILREALVGDGAWVTRSNPIRWRGDNVKASGHWYRDGDHFGAECRKGELRQQLVFRDSEGELPLAGFLTAIVLDDPKVGRYYEVAAEALEQANAEGPLDLDVESRACPKPRNKEACECLGKYANASAYYLRKRFDPNPPSLFRTTSAPPPAA